MTPEQFEQLVADGIDAIPERFLELLNNVAVVVADEPTADQREQFGLDHGWDLYGLYEGVPQSRRGPQYTAALPDKITIFKNPIEQAAGGDPEKIKKIVRDTVWHEIAHHFGMDEDEVEAAEGKRENY